MLVRSLLTVSDDIRKVCVRVRLQTKPTTPTPQTMPIEHPSDATHVAVGHIAHHTNPSSFGVARLMLCCFPPLSPNILTAVLVLLQYRFDDCKKSSILGVPTQTRPSVITDKRLKSTANCWPLAPPRGGLYSTRFPSSGRPPSASLSVPPSLPPSLHLSSICPSHSSRAEAIIT